MTGGVESWGRRMLLVSTLAHLVEEKSPLCFRNGRVFEEVIEKNLHKLLVRLNVRGLRKACIIELKAFAFVEGSELALNAKRMGHEIKTYKTRPMSDPIFSRRRCLASSLRTNIPMRP